MVNVVKSAGTAENELISSENSSERVSEQLSPEQLAEAKRIAKELVKRRDAGAIKDAYDPEARFYAQVLHLFEAEFLGKQPALFSRWRSSLLTSC